MNTTRDELRENALREDANDHQPDDHGPDICGDPECFTSCVVDGCDWPCATAWLRDQLDAAEARIKAVEELLADLEQQDANQMGWDAAGLLPDFRRALDGEG